MPTDSPLGDDATEIVVSLAEQRVKVQYLGDSMERLEESWHQGMGRLEQVLLRLELVVTGSERRVTDLEGWAKTMKGVVKWGAGIAAAVVTAVILVTLKLK